MIKKRIIFIILFSVVFCAIVGFVTYSIVVKSQQLSNNEEVIENGNGEVLTPYTPLPTNLEDITMFDDETRTFTNISNIIKTHWIVEYETDSDLVYINANENKISSSGQVYKSKVTVNFTPKFNYSNYEELKNRVFPSKMVFYVTTLPSTLQLTANVNKTEDINEFSVKIQDIKYKLDKLNLKVDNNESFEWLSATNNNDGAITLNEVKLKNKISETLHLTYSLTNDKNEKRTFTCFCNLKQRESFLQYSWLNAPINNNLYLTKDDVYSASYPNKATMGVTKNFDIENTSIAFQLNLGDETGLELVNGNIFAKKIGTYNVSLYLCGEKIETYTLNVINIPITSVNVGSLNRNINVGDVIDFTVQNEDIVCANLSLAIFDISYQIILGEEYATLSFDHKLTATAEGVCEVKIIVGNIEQIVTLTINEIAEPVFVIYKSDNSVLEEIEYSKTDLITNFEKNIQIKYSEGFKDSMKNISCKNNSDDCKIEYKEIDNLDINFWFNISNIEVGDEIIMQVTNISDSKIYEFKVIITE